VSGRRARLAVAAVLFILGFLVLAFWVAQLIDLMRRTDEPV